MNDTIDEDLLSVPKDDDEDTPFSESAVQVLAPAVGATGQNVLGLSNENSTRELVL